LAQFFSPCSHNFPLLPLRSHSSEVKTCVFLVLTPLFLFFPPPCRDFSAPIVSSHLFRFRLFCCSFSCLSRLSHLLDAPDFNHSLWLVWCLVWSSSSPFSRIILLQGQVGTTFSRPLTSFFPSSFLEPSASLRRRAEKSGSNFFMVLLLRFPAFPMIPCPLGPLWRASGKAP